jgi:hypothetical protein
MRKYLIIAFLSICYVSLFGSDLPVKLIKPDTLLIGRHFNIEVRIKQFDNQKILPPKNTGSDVVDIIKSSYKLEKTFYLYNLEIAAYDTGRVEIPPLTFYVSNSQSEQDKNSKILDSLQTQSFSVWVASSTSEADTTLNDIKKPISVYLKWQDYLFIIVLFYVISLLFVLYKKLRRSKNKQILESMEYDNRPAWKKCLDMLYSLKEQDLLSANEWVEYHYLLTMVIKYFLLLQYNIKAVEMTTYEIKETLDSDFKNKKELLEILNYCDQIKFAKFEPEKSVSIHYEKWLEDYLLSFRVVEAVMEAGK